MVWPWVVAYDLWNHAFLYNALVENRQTLSKTAHPLSVDPKLVEKGIKTDEKWAVKP